MFFGFELEEHRVISIKVLNSPEKPERIKVTIQ